MAIKLQRGGGNTAKTSYVSVVYLKMKRQQHDKLELEAELLKLNALVRERREQLARIEDCPNKGCHCRAVWREQVEKGLSSQVRKIRRRIGGKPKPAAKSKKAS
jgi:hypothetical protein